MAKREDDPTLPDFSFPASPIPPVKEIAKPEVIEFEGLSAEEVAEVRAAFDKKQDEEKKAKARKKLMEKFLQEAREAEQPKQERVEVEIVLPAFACTKVGYGDIMIDGRAFNNNQTYVVTRSQAEGLREVMQRAWDHEEVTFGGRNPNQYMRPRGDHVGKNGAVQAGAFLRF